MAAPLMPWLIVSDDMPSTTDILCFTLSDVSTGFLVVSTLCEYRASSLLPGISLLNVTLDLFCCKYGNMP